MKGAFNAVMVEGNAVGPLMFYGQGAGKMPTASAVVADIMDVVNNMDTCKTFCTCYDNLNIVDAKAAKSSFYVRLKTTGDQDAPSMISKIFDKRQINLSNISEIKTENAMTQITMITSEVPFNELEEALKDFQKVVSVEILNVIRVEEE